jgi:hypothetical protein
MNPTPREEGCQGWLRSSSHIDAESPPCGFRKWITRDSEKAGHSVGVTLRRLILVNAAHRNRSSFKSASVDRFRTDHTPLGERSDRICTGATEIASKLGLAESPHLPFVQRNQTLFLPRWRAVRDRAFCKPQ